MPSKWAWNENYKGQVELQPKGGEMFTDCHHMWLWWFWRWGCRLAPVSIRWAWECCWWRRMGLQVLWYLTFQLTWWTKLSISGTNVVPASTCVVEADQRQNGSGAFHHHRMNKDHPVLGHQTQDLLKVGPQSTSQLKSFKMYLIFKQKLNTSDLQAAATATTHARGAGHVKPPLADTQGREGPYVFKEDNSVTLLSFYHLELAFYDVWKVPLLSRGLSKTTFILGDVHCP